MINGMPCLWWLRFRFADVGMAIADNVSSVQVWIGSEFTSPQPAQLADWNAIAPI